MTTKNEPKTTVSLLASPDDPRLAHILRGIVAFASYELILSIVLQVLGLSRNLSLFPLELLAFALVTVCLSLHSTISSLRNQAIIQRHQNADEQRRLQSAQIAAYLSKKLRAFCQGIDHSLSA